MFVVIEVGESSEDNGTNEELRLSWFGSFAVDVEEKTRLIC